VPRYDYQCQKCGVREYTHSIHDVMTVCPVCGTPITRLISPPALGYDCTGYDEALGEYITSAKHRRQVMQRLGVREGLSDSDPRIVAQAKGQEEALRKAGRPLTKRLREILGK
jgi:putative FmdB family regulatory protein